MLLLSCTAHRKLSSPRVVEAFSFSTKKYGFLKSSLSDNELFYSTRLIGGKNAYEILLARPVVERASSRKSHPILKARLSVFTKPSKKMAGRKAKGQKLSRASSLA